MSSLSLSLNSCLRLFLPPAERLARIGGKWQQCVQKPACIAAGLRAIKTHHHRAVSLVDLLGRNKRGVVLFRKGLVHHVYGDHPALPEQTPDMEMRGCCCWSPSSII